MDAHRSRTGRLLSFAVALACGLLLGACSKTPETPEQQIQKVLAAGVSALETKDIGAAGDLLADGYRDARGRDKKRMKAIAFVVLRRGPVRLSLSDEVVEVDESGTRATVRAKVRALQTAGAPETVGGLLPRGRAVEVELSLVKEGDEWRVTAIDGDGVGAGLE